MKKSQRREMLARILSENRASEIIDQILAADEAAGIKWEPEEEPLPARLCMMHGASLGEYIVRAPGGNGWRTLNRREAEEVVRRWAAWPALRQLAHELERFGLLGAASDIREILDGSAE